MSRRSFHLLRSKWPVLMGLLILATGVLYIGIVLALAPYQGFWSGDAGVKLWQMEAWIANGWRTPWTSYAEVNTPVDPYHRLAPLRQPFAVWESDQVLTIYTLPYIFISSLLLAGGGRLALYVPSLIAGVGALIVAGRVGGRISVRVAFLCVLILGLATSWLFYSVTFWGHTVASLLIWDALVLVLPSLESPASRWAKGIVAGLCLGGAMAARPEAGVCVAALVAVMLFCRSMWRLLAWLMVGLGAMGLAGWGYQAVVLGAGTGGQVAMNFAPGAFGTAIWSVGRLFELSQIVMESRNLGVVVILSSSVLIFGLAHVYRRLRPDDGKRFGLVVECIGLVLAAVGMTLLVLRGHQPIDLLRGAPVIGLLLLGWAERTKISESRRVLRRRLLGWCVLVIILTLVLGRQSGGWQWGPRYLLPVLGPLVFLAVEQWERLDCNISSPLKRYALRSALAALVVAGVVSQGMGVVKLWRMRAGNDALTRELLRTPSTVVIITDIWFVPQSAPEVYGQMPFLVVHTAEEWSELEGRLQARGIERVRLVRLAHFETLLAGHVSARWRSLADTSVVVPGIPPLVVVDYVPREP